MIRRCEFVRVRDAVRASGVAAELEELLNPRRTGRPRTLSVETYLTAAILAADTYQSTTQTRIHQVLTRDLARSLRVQLGLVGPDGHEVSIDQVRYVMDAIAAHLTPDEDDGTEEARQEVLDALADRILASTVPPEFATPREVAMDSTAVKAFARGKRREDRPDDAADPDDRVVETGPAADRDATWGYCTRTQDNGGNRVFGYAAFTIVGVAAVGADRDGMPKLTVLLRLRPANADVVAPGLDLLRAAADAADAAGVPRLPSGARLCLMADMAWSFKLPERWALPALEAGADLVFDLHPADRGVLDHEGLLMVDGWPHCPAMPAHLHDVARPERLKVGELKPGASARARLDHARAAADLERFSALMAERECYAFRRVSNRDDNGSERFECPARAGKIRCEGCPLSELLDPGLPETVDPPLGAAAPRCCRQRTITLSREVDAKRRQRLRWGTDPWNEAYTRRVQVEGSYGRMKSSSGGNVRRGWCHARRKAKITLLLACAIAASNLAVLRGWARRTGNQHLPMCQEDPPDHGFEELDADGNIDPAGPDEPHAPPGPPA